MGYEDIIAGPLEDIKNAVKDSDLYKDNEVSDVQIGRWDNDQEYPLVAIIPFPSQNTDNKIWEEPINVYVLDKDTNKDQDLVELGKLTGKVADVIEKYYSDNKNDSDISWLKMSSFEFGNDLTNEYVSGWKFELDVKVQES